MLPRESQREAFLQLLVLDETTQLHRRLQNNEEYKKTKDKKKRAEYEGIVEQLQDMLSKCNPFVHAFQFAKEYVNRNEDFRIVIENTPMKDRRIFNKPMLDEIAIVVDMNTIFESRDIIVKPRNDPPRQITEDHVAYDAMHYILMHPKGENGFQQNIAYRNDRTKSISIRQYYSYHLQVRYRLHFQLYGRLFHEYAIDMYVKVLSNELKWFRYHQERFRFEIYSGILDAASAGETANNIGMKVVLPHQFVGGPRYYREKFLNSLEIVRTMGKPTLTLTFTCNPNWPEIRNVIPSHQNPNDRPDIEVRVFYQKLKLLRQDLISGLIFGKVISYMHIIEFQKRGK